MQFWDLFSICNQTGVTLASVWDGAEIKLNFRRTFSEAMLERWYELEAVVMDVHYSEEGDALVWQYDSKGLYTTQSLYAVINFRGVKPVYIPSV